MLRVACTKTSVSVGVCFVSGGRLVNTFVSYTLGRCSKSPYFEMIALAFNVDRFRNNTMGIIWIDLKCSSQYVLTRL